MSVLADVRHAVRSLRRSPGFAALVAGTLALGIGASLAMLNLMWAVLWRPLPYPEPDRIVTLRVEARGVSHAGATTRELHELGSRSRSLQQVATLGLSDADLEAAGESGHVTTAHVSDALLPLLGARPARGRLLDSRIDVGEQQASAVLISHELWRRRFASDPGIVGRSVRVDGADVSIAGVLPAGFRLLLPVSVGGTEEVDVWLPHRLDLARPFRGNPVVARLRDGVTVAAANAELEALVAQLAREQPQAYEGASVRMTARPLHDAMTRGSRPALFLLAGAVASVLLIACVNVANLMLARGAARRRELEIRRAVGAGRGRIVRQLLAESLVLAAMASALGVLVASQALEAIARLGASRIPLGSRIGLDVPTALAGVALCVGVSLLFGLWPARRLAADESGSVLRSGRAETTGAGGRRLQRLLVVAEIALSILPLVCGGLLLRSFVNLSQAPLGFVPEGVMTARVPIDTRRFPEAGQRWALLQDVMRNVRAIPGVQDVSAANPLPLAGQHTRRVGRLDRPDAVPLLATQQTTAPGYLGVVGTPLVQGRDFTGEDVAAVRNVTIVDERLARRLWPEGAVGRILSVYRTGWRHDLEVVGVTRTARVSRVSEEDVLHFLIPFSAYPLDTSLVVRTALRPDEVAPQIQAAVAQARTGRAAFDVRPMTSLVSDSIGDTRFLLLVLAAFAAASVALAAVGLYGTLAYLATQRTREFGIRLALGSSVRSLVAIVLREGALLAAGGAGVGLAATAIVAGAIRELLYGVRPLDSLTLVGVMSLVGLVALVAATVPAWRVTRIDPNVSLRSE